MRSLLALQAGGPNGPERASPESECVILSQSCSLSESSGVTARPLHTWSSSRNQSRAVAGPWAMLSLASSLCFHGVKPSMQPAEWLEPWVSAAIRAWDYKFQDDSIWDNSLSTKSQTILKNHPEIHTCSNISFVSEPSLGVPRKRVLSSFCSLIPGCE